MREDNETAADVDVFAQEPITRSPSSDPEWVALPSADLLEIDGADVLLRRRAVAIIAVVGERSSGKTTLVAEIYERFLRGPFAGNIFCDSHTLLAFERKTFDSRVESGGKLPNTARTSTQEGLGFFHLSLAPEGDPATSRDILLSERAGETYRAARDNPLAATQFVELRRARFVVFMLDGERVADPLRRQEAFAAVRGLIRAFLLNGTLRTDTHVQLVTSKFDLLRPDGAELARKALDDFEAQTVAGFAASLGSIAAWRTAARDPTGGLDPAWGVDRLLQAWLVPPAVPAPTPAQVPALTSEFDRLFLRREAVE